MKLKLLLLLSLVFQFGYSQWTPLNSGTTDNLTGIGMHNLNGLVSGENGLYYTTDQGTTWTPFVVTGNAADEAVYNNTSFSDCVAPTGWQPTISFYACGKNTLTDQAVIFKVNFPSLTYAIVYTGPVGSTLNAMMYTQNANVYYAAGDNGLIVKVNNDTPASVINTNSTENFKSMAPGVFAVDDKLIFGTIDYLGLSILQEVPLEGAVSAVMSWNNSNIGYGVGTSYATRNGAAITNYMNFDFGPLNPKDISDYTNNAHLVATDHGIFRSGSGRTFLEWQPTSGTGQFNDILNISSVETYAVGNNGVILKTTNGGGPAKPYINLDLTIRCFGTNSLLKAMAGSSSSCQWFVDGNLVSSSCAQLNYQFPNIGVHTVSLTSTNASGLFTTDTETVTVVNPPQINLPVTINDQILCNLEPIEITIQNSQVDVVYTLNKQGDMGTFGTSQPGTGGTITFTSTPIDLDGIYFISAKSIYGACLMNFTDTFSIDVEETEALFSSTLINANVNEPFTMYSQSIEAQNFEWTFSPGGTSSGSSLEDVTLSYGQTGATEATLHTWSNNGCHNTITAAGPYIYDAPAPADSWTIFNNGTDISNGSPELPSWTGDHELESTELAKVSDGLLNTGQYKDQIFASRAGVTLDLAGKSGSYLTKHDLDGVLKFVVYTEKAPSSAKDAMMGAVADSQGNIYISCNTLGHFYDSTGTMYDFGTSSWTESDFIIKLDPDGRYLWRLQARMFFPMNLYIDNNDNLVTTSIVIYQQPSEFKLDGVGTGQFITGMEITQSNEYEYLVTKFTPDGAMIWDAPVYTDDANGSYLTSLDFDAANNMYMTGIFEIMLDMHSADGSSSEGFSDFDNNYGGRTFVAKYNEDGIIQWLIRSKTVDPFSVTTVPYDMVTDEAGNSYITGRNHCAQPGSYQRFENHDGTVTDESTGAFFVAKVNTNGVCEWIRGAAHTNSGWGSQILKHNNEISVIGEFSNYGAEVTTATFNSTDDFSYALTLNYDDYFMATYDTAGNILRITGNGENPDSYNMKYFSGFSKGEGDSYYLSGSFRIYDQYPYTNFGELLPQTNNTDAFLTKFNEASGIQYMSRVLGVNGHDADFAVSLYPNPSNGNFTIALGETVQKTSVKITDITGKKIFANDYHDVSEINEKVIGATGIYFIKVVSGSKVSVLKFIKE